YTSSTALCSLTSFPTRRSSDLASEKGTHMSRFMGLIDEYHAKGMDAKLFKEMAADMLPLLNAEEGEIRVTFPYFIPKKAPVSGVDRKSTRLNSSHVSISYAVFC